MRFRDEIRECTFCAQTLRSDEKKSFSSANQTIRVEAISFPNFPFALISVSNWYTQANHIFATATKTRPNLFTRITYRLNTVTCAQETRVCALTRTHKTDSDIRYQVEWVSGQLGGIISWMPQDVVYTFFTAASQNEWAAQRFKHLQQILIRKLLPSFAHNMLMFFYLFYRYGRGHVNWYCF